MKRTTAATGMAAKRTHASGQTQPKQAPAAGGVKITVRPATPSRWADLEMLFGERGACAGCWCMYFRLRQSEWARAQGSGNRRALKKLVESGSKPGLIAYAGRQPVGWCALAPREDYPRLGRSRVLAPVDDRPVWSVTCFFVDRKFRGQGVTEALLREAVAQARRRGARIVEGYPIDTGGRRYADTFAYHGLVSTFRKTGFRETLRRSKTRPIMRIETR